MAEIMVGGHQHPSGLRVLQNADRAFEDSNFNDRMERHGWVSLADFPAQQAAIFNYKITNKNVTIQLAKFNRRGNSERRVFL